MAAKLSEDQTKEIKEAFFMFDINNSGKIKTSELGTAVRSLGMNPSEAEIAQMVKEADPKGRGDVNEKEFVHVVSSHWCPANAEDDIIDAFKVFDREGTGYMEAKELRNVLLNLGEKLSEQEVEEIIKAAEPDVDGQLNYTTLAQVLLADARR